MAYASLEERAEVYDRWEKHRNEIKEAVERNGHDYDKTIEPFRVVIRKACQGVPTIPPRKLMEAMLKNKMPDDKRLAIIAASYDVYEEMYPYDPYRQKDNTKQN